MRILGILALTFVTTACTTTLATRPARNDTTHGVIGAPYYLPALQYEAVVTRTMSDCTTKEDAVTPEFEMKVELKPQYVQGEMFVADYRELSSWTKTTALGIKTHPNQTLKSINVSAKDESPEIIAGFVKAGLTLAKINLGLVAALEGKAITCPASLPQVKAWRTDVKRIGEELTELTAQLDKFMTAAALGGLTEADKKKVLKLTSEIATRSAAIKTLQTSIEERSKGFSLQETVFLRPAKGDFVHALPFPGPKGVEQERRLQWLSTLLSSTISAEQVEPFANDLSLVARLQLQQPTDFGSETCMNAGLEGCELTGAPKWNSWDKALPGIAFRNPVPSRLQVCKGTKAEDCLDPSRVLASNDAAAPQLGRLVVLPFENGFGANNKLSAEFRADGSLESMDYGTPEGASSAGRNITTNVNSIMDEALKFEQARLAKKQADKDAAAAATTSALDAQIATLKKQQELLLLQTAMDPANLAAKAELDALNAQIARLTAQKTIKELEDALN